jgi:steroid 5-alpha reductase family enzyme
MLPWFVFCAVVLSLCMAGAWGLQRVTGNSGWVDAVWSFSIGLAGVLLALLPGVSTRRVVVAMLIAVWAVRLGAHIAHRSFTGPEDARYAALRTEWGAGFQQRLFWFLQIQAVAAAFLTLSMGLAASNPAPFPRGQDVLGMAVLVVAILGEGVAGAQLRRFKGRVCDAGLWGLSRHPNYFFEWLGWFAYPLFAIDAGRFDWAWLSLSGPAFMYWLLVHVSGIPLLEQHMIRSRGDAYRAYQQRVNAFFPAFHRRVVL